MTDTVPYTDDWLAPNEVRCALCGDVWNQDDMVRRAIDEPSCVGELVCGECAEQMDWAAED